MTDMNAPGMHPVMANDCDSGLKADSIQNIAFVLND